MIELAIGLMFVGMAGYSQQEIGRRLGDSLRRIIRAHGLTEEQVYLGHCDKATWSKMLNGESPLDFNRLYRIVPLDPFFAFLSRCLSMRVEEHAQQMKTEAEESAGKVA